MSNKSGRWSDQRRIRAVRESELAHMGQWGQSIWTLHLIRDADDWLELVIASVESASDLMDRNLASDLFYSYSVLAHRWTSHHRALQTLIGLGRFGETTALTRMLIELTDIITFLSLHPDEASEWRDRHAREPGKRSRSFNDEELDFSMSRVRKALKDAGFPTIAKLDRKHMNSAVHASIWGSAAYAQRDPMNPGHLNLTFTPSFDHRTAFIHGLFVNETLPRPSDAFIRMCETVRAPKSAWRKLEARHDELLANWEATKFMGRNMTEINDEVEERLRRGESFDQITKDIDQRLADEINGDTTIDAN